MTRGSTKELNRGDTYDPFVRGRFPVGVRTFEAMDQARDCRFPCEIWYPAASRHVNEDLTPGAQDVFTAPRRDAPRSQMAVRDAAAQPGEYPLIVFSHHSGGNRRSATFLCTHLSSHGYVVAALDHSEVVAAKLAPKEGETAQQRAALGEAWLANRVPDIGFLLDLVLNSQVLNSQVLNRTEWDSEVQVDPTRIGIVGHSLGGWTALAAPEAQRDIRAVVALAPGGTSHPKPGMLPAKLAFHWRRDVPTLYLVAENDTMTSLDGMIELFERTPATKQMIILRRADHLHFMDNVEQEHETVRNMTWSGELAWISKEMRPMAELCSGQQAQLFVRGLTLCHMDAVLRRQTDARQLLAGDVEAKLGERGIDAIVHRPQHL